MGRVGPTDTRFHHSIDGSTWTELDDVRSFSGGEVTAEKADTTAFGDLVRTMGAIGRKAVGDITFSIPYDDDAGTAYTLIGRETTSPSATPWYFRVTYATGKTVVYRVNTEKNWPGPVLEDQTYCEVLLYQSGTALVVNI